MLAMATLAIGNATISQNYLSGLSNAMNAVLDPDRYASRFLDQYAASIVPRIIGQTAAAMDPTAREIDSITAAIQAQIPLAREKLRPRRDAFGEPVTADRAFPLAPVQKTQVSTDPVRAEAARLGVSIAATPKAITLPAGHDKKLGKVELTPGQRDVFGDVAGHLAHDVLAPIVASASWEPLPDMVKKRIYEVAFERARAGGRAAALPADQRAAEAARITDELVRRLAQ
jgi:hypothetical protein